jgi:hypothetical protein
MTTKQWMLIALAVVLAGTSIYLNRDWFASDDIHIMYRSVAGRQAMSPRRQARPQATNPLYFGFDRKLKLTAVKVVALADLETNKYPHALWDLTTESNSVPTRGFFYGASIPGMRPSFKGAAPEPLQPEGCYRLFIEAGSKKAFRDFLAEPRSP